MVDMKTGDILLFDYKAGGAFGIFTKLIKYFTKSDYSHVAMVLKDPTFIHPSLKGTYIWESSWEGKPDPQDGKIKLGVQITPFLEIYDQYKYHNSSIYLRRVNCDPTLFNEENLKKIHDVVYNKPYDIIPKDWVGAITRDDPDPQRVNRFWCSALVGYIYTKCGLLKPDTDWSNLRASDFSIKYEGNLKYDNGASLDMEEIEILR
uniref:Peptidase n=1 Tax=viral metagenome TaxID=1070528 RepID=A0A6C0JCG8_9ZZZZ